MSYYVYILESESDHTYYKGSNSDIVSIKKVVVIAVLPFFTN